MRAVTVLERSRLTRHADSRLLRPSAVSGSDSGHAPQLRVDAGISDAASVLTRDSRAIGAGAADVSLMHCFPWPN